MQPEIFQWADQGDSYVHSSYKHNANEQMLSHKQFETS